MFVTHKNKSAASRVSGGEFSQVQKSDTALPGPAQSERTLPPVLVRRESRLWNTVKIPPCWTHPDGSRRSGEVEGTRGYSLLGLTAQGHGRGPHKGTGTRRGSERAANTQAVTH